MRYNSIGKKQYRRLDNLRIFESKYTKYTNRKALSKIDGAIDRRKVEYEADAARNLPC